MKITLSVTNDLVTDQRVHKVCTTLLQNGYEVELVGRVLGGQTPPLRRDYRTKRLRLLFNKGALFYAEYNLRLLIYLLFHKTDVYLSNDTDTLIANYLASKIRHRPLVFDAHELFPEVPEVTNRPFVKTVWTKIEAWIFPKLQHTYTVCQSIADYYHKKYGIEMGVVRNIPPARRRGGVCPPSPQSPPPPQSKKIILYQGAVNEGRGIEQIIEAMPHLPTNYIFQVVGSGDKLDELKTYAAKLGLSDRVIFTGKLPFEELSTHTARAAIGVNLLENKGLSYYYALPNRIFDYMRCNVPVLSSDFPEIRRIVDKYQIGVLVETRRATSLQQIADEIKKLAEQPKNLAGFAAANAELTWENEAKTLLQIINNAAQK
jgi:glycosyltransferase involved in cell wall biosynthesis